jgi:uncharacterized protein
VTGPSAERAGAEAGAAARDAERPAATALAIADWRRRVTALYARVRAAGDPAAAHADWIATRDELFATHPATPLLPEDRAGFAGLPVAPYDPEWRFELEPLAAEPFRLEVETGTDGVVPFDRVARLELPRGLGALDVWRLASYGGGLFVPLRDGLAGRTGSDAGPGGRGTYGGGRYVLDTVKGADHGERDGRIVLDLNFAYNPSCAYDPAWACPLAPPGNVLRAAVPVGELYG